MTTGHLFLSHSSADADAARELRTELERAGYSCWMAPDDVDGTDSWAEQILAAIEACEAMLVLISTSANRSTHVSREVNLALGRKRPVFPIRIENVVPEASLEYLLSLVQRVDAFPPPISNHAPRILRRLEATLRKGGRPASEPAALTGSAAPTEPLEPPTEPLAAPTESVAPPPADIPPAPPAIAATAALGTGTRIGAFTIDGVLGEGGMATVYRARQEEPRRAVALKVIRADHAANPVYRQRFLAEKDTLAALEHPSIVPIYAAGESDGVLYIAMRLVDGPDLAGRLERQGRMSLAEAVATLRPIADAVDYAHESGVIHRDLKPSNIILDRHGRPYLTDFGLGKQLDKSHGLSAPGVALGTLAYMAPEQFTGLSEPALAGRVDVYALACVAHACLTGEPPFAGETPERMMYAHLHESLPNRPDLPNGVETVLRRGLAKNPADRYASAAEFITALAEAGAVTEHQTVPVIIPGRRGNGGPGAWVRANRGIAGAGATVVALVVVATLVFGAGGGNPNGSPDPSGTQAAVGSATVPPGPAASGTPVAPATALPTMTVGPTSTAPPTHSPTPTRPPTAPPDTTPPTGGKIVINDGDGFTTSGSVTITVTTKPTDGQSTIDRYVWSTTNSRPASGSDGYVKEFDATIATGSRGTRTIYVWFRNSAGIWSTSAVKDTITFDRAPVRSASCAPAQEWTTPEIDTQYKVYINTNCFSDPDGDDVTIYFANVNLGTFQTGSGCAAGTTCVFWNAPIGWDQQPTSVTFEIYARDDLTAKSGVIDVNWCVACP